MYWTFDNSKKCKNIRQNAFYVFYNMKNYVLSVFVNSNCTRWYRICFSDDEATSCIGYDMRKGQLVYGGKHKRITLEENYHKQGIDFSLWSLSYNFTTAKTFQKLQSLYFSVLLINKQALLISKHDDFFTVAFKVL